MVFKPGNDRILMKPFRFANIKSISHWNEVANVNYSSNLTFGSGEDILLYAYRVGGIINAFINNVQVLTNKPSTSSSLINFTTFTNYAIAEIILYNSALTQAESDGLKNYMLQKYSLGPYAV